MPAVTRLEEYRNLLDAQRLIAKDIRDESVKPVVRSMLAKTLVQVIDMKRTMRGIGKPKPVDHDKRKRSNPTPLAPSE